MRKLKRLTLGVLLAFLLVSCQSYKKVPYLQDTAFVNDTEPVSYTHLDVYKRQVYHVRKYTFDDTTGIR